MKQPADLDKYYTPLTTARELVAMGAHIHDVSAVVDPNCGGGSLLRAATEQWNGARLRGLDIDRGAVNLLRAQCSDWDVAVGSVYPDAQGPRAWHSRVQHDLILTNPPFSMESRRYMEVVVAGKTHRCSLAMAHVVAAVGRLRPRFGVLAVMPESSLFTDLDSAARDILGKQLRLRVGTEVRNSAFQGARARAILCSWLRPDVGADEADLNGSGVAPALTRGKLKANVVRGSLPVFRAQPSAKGLRFLHSTDLGIVDDDRGVPRQKVEPLGSGRVDGHVVLLSRVGEPRPEHVVALKLLGEVQLSDCVIALKVGSRRDSLRLRKLVLSQWDSFASLYRGTGARFTTVARLTDWLRRHAVETS